MMENLFIAPNQRILSEISPLVDFNAETGICRLEGESFMENPFDFYEKPIAWCNTYLADNDSLILHIKLTYFNTTSARAITYMLSNLKRHQDTAGKKIEVFWYYPDPDEDDFLLDGKDIEASCGLIFQYIPYKV